MSISSRCLAMDLYVTILTSELLAWYYDGHPESKDRLLTALAQVKELHNF
jgi:hypothetical protein